MPAAATVALLTALGLGKSSAATPNLIGDGLTLNTAAFNSALESLYRNGGGTFTVPPGCYLTGTIYLQDNVTLHLDNGAVILGSTNIADYPENPPPRPDPKWRLEWGRFSLIYAAGKTNFAITGEGEINGQGSSPFFTKSFLTNNGCLPRDAYLKRPFGLCFAGCKNILVRNVTLRDIAFWCEDYLDCENVLVDGVNVDSLKEDYNNDGIDVDGSHDVRISNCHFLAGDDGICLKSSYSVCENITINNCVIRSMANGIKFGTASRGGFKNISIANCSVYQTWAAGLALEIVDGGTLDGVTVANLTMREVGTPIFIRLGNRGKQQIEEQSTNPPPGIVRNVVISGITATMFNERENRPIACSISGLTGYPVENVSVSDIKITTLHDFGPATEIPALDKIPESITYYPECSMFGRLPAYGFYCRHVRNLTFRDLDLDFARRDPRAALVFDDVTGLMIDGLRAQTFKGLAPVVRLNNTTNVLFTRCVAPTGTHVFLKAEGHTKNVFLHDCELSGAAKAVAHDTDAEKPKLR